MTIHYYAMHLQFPESGITKRQIQVVRETPKTYFAEGKYSYQIRKSDIGVLRGDDFFVTMYLTEQDETVFKKAVAEKLAGIIEERQNELDEYKTVADGLHLLSVKEDELW